MEKIRILDKMGAPTKDLMYSLRRDGDSGWLFIANMYKPELPHLINRKDIEIKIKGNLRPTVYDTLTGNTYTPCYKAKGGVTSVYTTLYDLDTILLKLDYTESESEFEEKRVNSCVTELYHPTRVGYKRTEPNVLLLDMAEYSVNGSPFYAREEIMRIDAKVRDSLSLRQRRTKVVQPWAIAGEPEEHELKILFRFESRIAVNGARLAMENPERAVIEFNSEKISSEPIGYYVDRGIKTVQLPEIRKGENTLLITMPFGMRTDFEACYIVGDFGVEYVGREAFIKEDAEVLHFGSVVHQGMPFYGGNVEYLADVTLDEDSDIRITLSHYRGALVKVEVDGAFAGRIVCPPFTLTVRGLKAGVHRIKYTLFGTRYNTFSALHNLNAGKKRVYMGPDFWGSENEAWAYEYETRPMGILKTPVIEKIKH